jgi:hypothetical protein
MKKPISYLYREIILKVNETIDKYYSDEDAIEYDDVLNFKESIKDINLFNVEKFDEDKCQKFFEDNRYESWIEREEILHGAIEEVRKSGTPMNNIVVDGRHYCSREVVSRVTGFCKIFLAWTYYFGGGKYGEPYEVEWMDNCYLVVEKEEVKVVKVYEKVNDTN